MQDSSSTVFPETLATTAPGTTPLSPKIVARTAGAELASTVANSLAVVAGFAWVQALQSLFDPAKGVFRNAAQYGPWIVAVVATLLATFATQILRNVLGIRSSK